MVLKLAFDSFSGLTQGLVRRAPLVRGQLAQHQTNFRRRSYDSLMPCIQNLAPVTRPDIPDVIIIA
jgi:hypothetical protein